MDNNEEILQLLNRLLEELHQADGNNKKGSTVINIYGKGSQHADKIEKQIIYTDACSKLVKDNKETPPLYSGLIDIHEAVPFCCTT